MMYDGGSRCIIKKIERLPPTYHLHPAWRTPPACALKTFPLFTPTQIDHQEDQTTSPRTWDRYRQFSEQSSYSENTLNIKNADWCGVQLHLILCWVTWLCISRNTEVTSKQYATANEKSELDVCAEDKETFSFSSAFLHGDNETQHKARMENTSLGNPSSRLQQPQCPSVPTFPNNNQAECK